MLKFYLNFDFYFFKTGANCRKNCFVIPPTFIEILTENYKNYFELALSGGATRESQEKFSAILASQGLNISEDKSWHGAFKTLINALKSCSGSSESDKEDLKEAVDNFVSISESWVRSQPGLSDFPASPKLRADHRFDEFFAMNDQFKFISKKMIEDPAWALSFFNAETAAGYAHFDETVIKVSKMAVEMQNC